MNETSAPCVIEAAADGIVGRWLKHDGDHVERDEEIVELETDKVTTACPAPTSGYLEIVAAEGAAVAAGEPIARLAVAPPVALQGSPADAGPDKPAPAANGRGERGSTPSGMPAAEVLVGEGGAPLATPLARQLAAEYGVSLAAVAGSGPGARVTRKDVAATLGLSPAAPQAARHLLPADEDASEVQELSRHQQTVARRMSEARASVPSFEVETEVRMDRAVALRDELRRLGDLDPLPSITDYVVKASALALRDHPRVNGSYRDGRFVLWHHVNVGIAVAAEDGLFVPVITDADDRPLGEIAAATAAMAERVRAGAPTASDFAAATFTISNLGMFGMTAITPIIDAPQAAILGVGSIRETVTLDGTEVVAQRLMTLRLSCDHRILYGADAARFLARVRELLEEPLRLLL